MNLKKFFYAQGVVYELGRGLILLVVVLILIHFFIATIFVVRGASMKPNFTNGEFILTDKIQYLVNEPTRGDVVILKFPGDPDRQKYIKRIIGMPGEGLEIKNAKVYIEGEQLIESYIETSVPTGPNMDIKLGSDEYFVVGDNRPNSSDSRYWGTVQRRDLIGKAIFRITPLDQFGFIAPIYYQ